VILLGDLMSIVWQDDAILQFIHTTRIWVALF